MRRTLYNHLLAKRTLSSATRANGTADGTSVNTVQFKTWYSAGTALIQTATMTDGSHAVTIQDSTDGSSGWTAIPAARLQGANITLVAADDDTLYEQGFIVDAARPHVRVSVTTSGATTGGVFSALLLLGEANNYPVARA